MRRAAAGQEGARGSDGREAILEAALVCFANLGYEGTSIREIAGRAGRNCSLIGHHFGSKEGLYVEVFRHVFRSRPSFLADPDGAGGPLASSAEALNLLRDLIHRVFLAFNHAPGRDPQDPAVLGRNLLLHELRNPNPQVLDLFRERLAPWFQRFVECLRILKPDLADPQRVFLGVSILGEMMSHLLLRGLRSELSPVAQVGPAEAVELLTEFNLRGLGLGEAIPGPPGAIPSSRDRAIPLTETAGSNLS